MSEQVANAITRPSTKGSYSFAVGVLVVADRIGVASDTSVAVMLLTVPVYGGSNCVVIANENVFANTVGVVAAIAVEADMAAAGVRRNTSYDTSRALANLLREASATETEIWPALMLVPMVTTTLFWKAVTCAPVKSAAVAKPERETDPRRDDVASDVGGTMASHLSAVENGW
jgi:hypothetical protein